MPTVVILLSDKRSGSTMFQDELCRHPAVSTVPYSPHTYLETHWWLMGAVLLERPGALFLSGRPYEGYGTRKNARAYMIDLLEKCVPDFDAPTDDRNLVFKGWEALCQRFGQPVFFEKSPQFVSQWAALSLMLEWIEETECTVRVIGMIRNPHGVMYSANELFGTDPAARQFSWLAGCRNLLAFSSMLPRHAYMQVRYEDLVRDPVARFADVTAFLGLPPDAACGSGTHTASSEKWRRDPSYTLGLDAAVVQMAHHLGYRDEELVNPHASDTSVARSAPAPTAQRSIGLWLNRRRHQILRPLAMRLRSARRTGR